MRTKIRTPKPTLRLPDVEGRLALRVSEVARLIGASAATVRQMISAGTIPGRRIGRGEESATFVIPVDGLLAWLNGGPAVEKSE